MYERLGSLEFLLLIPPAFNLQQSVEIRFKLPYQFMAQEFFEAHQLKFGRDSSVSAEILRFCLSRCQGCACPVTSLLSWV